MARTVAGLPEGSRVSDYIALGVLAERIPVRAVHEALRKEGRQSERQRLLPAHVMVYYVMALALPLMVNLAAAVTGWGKQRGPGQKPWPSSH